MARAEKQSEYGPAACANSTRSVRASRHGRARVRQRTGAEGGQAPPEMRFLVGFARPRAIVLRHTVRPSPDFGLPTRFEHTGYVDKRYEGNLDEFGAAHLPNKKEPVPAPPKAAGNHAAASVNEVIQPAAGRTALVERLNGAAAVASRCRRRPSPTEESLPRRVCTAAGDNFTAHCLMRS